MKYNYSPPTTHHPPPRPPPTAHCPLPAPLAPVRLTRPTRAAPSQNVKPNFLLYRRKQEVAPPRACLCHHVRGQLRVSRSRANQRQINEIKLKRKADAQAYALAGLPSADLWPFVATRGPQAGQQQPALAGQQQPAPLAWMRQVAPVAPPGSLGSAQKRKAEATADLRQKLRRTQ